MTIRTYLKYKSLDCISSCLLRFLWQSQFIWNTRVSTTSTPDYCASCDNYNFLEIQESRLINSWLLGFMWRLSLITIITYLKTKITVASAPDYCASCDNDYLLEIQEFRLHFVLVIGLSVTIIIYLSTRVSTASIPDYCASCDNYN